MFEDHVSSVPSMLSYVISWFTPTVLFLFLNLTIGTIVVASSFATRKHHQQRHETEPNSFSVRSISLLHRLQSINFSSSFENIAESETHFVSEQIYEQERPQLARSPSLLQRLKSFNLCNYISHEYRPAPETQTHMSRQEIEGEDEQAVDEDGRKSLDEIFSQVGRTKSDTEPSSGTVPTKLTRKMEKSASTNTSSAHSKEEEDIADAQRSAAMKEDKEALAKELDVDAKADDFINKFKQQLKLQRLESIMRYKLK